MLSHCHTDHLRDLSLVGSSSEITLFCTEITAKILLEIPLGGYSELKALTCGSSRKYKHLEPIIKTMKFNVPYLIELELGTVQATMLPANHCPGASMILLQGARGSVLYTGDFRSERYQNYL